MNIELLKEEKIKEAEKKHLKEINNQIRDQIISFYLNEDRIYFLSKILKKLFKGESKLTDDINEITEKKAEIERDIIIKNINEYATEKEKTQHYKLIKIPLNKELNKLQSRKKKIKSRIKEYENEKTQKERVNQMNLIRINKGI